MDFLIETVVVAAFIVSSLLLVGGSVVAMFLGISADEPEEIPLIGHRSGPLTFLLGRILVRQLDQGLPITLASLKRLAERAA